MHSHQLIKLLDVGHTYLCYFLSFVTMRKKEQIQNITNLCTLHRSVLMVRALMVTLPTCNTDGKIDCPMNLKHCHIFTLFFILQLGTC